MPRPRKETDPLADRRRKLAEKERLLSEHRKKLTEQLNCTVAPAAFKRAEPPVWRMEEEHTRSRNSEPTPARKRHLARQRQRDMVLFFIFIVLLLVVLGAAIWVAYVRNTIPINGT
jgi:hypothetical protein